MANTFVPANHLRAVIVDNMQPSSLTPKSIRHISVDWTPNEFAYTIAAKTKKRCHSVQIYSIIYLDDQHVLVKSQRDPRNCSSPKLTVPMHESFVPSQDTKTTIGELAYATAALQANIPSLLVGQYAGYYASTDDHGYQAAVIAIVFHVRQKRLRFELKALEREDRADWGSDYLGIKVLWKEDLRKMTDFGSERLKMGIMAGFKIKGVR